MSDFLLKLTLGAVEETLAQATFLENKPDTAARTSGTRCRRVVAKSSNARAILTSCLSVVSINISLLDGLVVDVR